MYRLEWRPVGGWLAYNDEWNVETLPLCEETLGKRLDDLENEYHPTDVDFIYRIVDPPASGRYD